MSLSSTCIEQRDQDNRKRNRLITGALVISAVINLGVLALSAVNTRKQASQPEAEPITLLFTDPPPEQPQQKQQVTPKQQRLPKQSVPARPVTQSAPPPIARLAKPQPIRRSAAPAPRRPASQPSILTGRRNTGSTVRTSGTGSKQAKGLGIGSPGGTGQGPSSGNGQLPGATTGGETRPGLTNLQGSSSAIGPVAKRLPLKTRALPRRTAPPPKQGGTVVCKKCPKPKYPKKALENGFEGSTQVKLNFDAKGRVTGVKLLKSSGNKDVDAAVLKQAKKYRLKSGGKAGSVPLKVSHNIQGSRRSRQTPKKSKRTAQFTPKPKVARLKSPKPVTKTASKSPTRTTPNSASKATAPRVQRPATPARQSNQQPQGNSAVSRKPTAKVAKPRRQSQAKGVKPRVKVRPKVTKPRVSQQVRPKRKRLAKRRKPTVRVNPKAYRPKPKRVYRPKSKPKAYRPKARVKPRVYRPAVKVRPKARPRVHRPIVRVKPKPQQKIYRPKVKVRPRKTQPTVP